MTLVHIVAVAYLAISVVALVAQSSSLATLRRQRGTDEKFRGLVRTVTCRVAASALYVALGIGALMMAPEAALIATFVCYIATTCLWLVNSRADIRLGQLLRRSPNPGSGEGARTGATPEGT